MRVSPSRTLLVVALAAVGLGGTAVPAMAHMGGDHDGHRGTVGRHAFADTLQRSGARCSYESSKVDSDQLAVVTAGLARVTVRPPRVLAVDRSDGRDRQRVGWSFILQERVGSQWIEVKRSSLQTRRASDRQPAKFARMAVRYDGKTGATYKIKTKAYWFKPRMRRVGVAVHQVRQHRIRGEVVRRSCPGEISAPEAP